MSITKLDHIAIAVQDVESSAELWKRTLGLDAGDIEVVAERGVRLCKLKADRVPDLELVEPIGEDSPVASFIAQKGEGIHHICFEVRDIEKSLEELKRNGVRLVHERPVSGAGGRRIAFIHPQSLGGVLIELIEEE